jgi:hypothetical protein
VHRDLEGLRSEIAFERVMKLRLRREVNRREITEFDHELCREGSDHVS